MFVTESKDKEERNVYHLYASNHPGDHLSIQREVVEELVFDAIADNIVRLESIDIAGEIEGLNPPPEVLDNVLQLKIKVRTLADVQADLDELEDEMRHLFRSRDERKSSEMIESLLTKALEDEKRLRAEARMIGHHFLEHVETSPDDPINQFTSGPPLKLRSIRPWLAEASLAEKRALVAQWIERIEIGNDKDAIRKLKEEHGIDPE